MSRGALPAAIRGRERVASFLTHPCAPARPPSVARGSQAAEVVRGFNVDMFYGMYGYISVAATIAADRPTPRPRSDVLSTFALTDVPA
ncbi:hypothetical protein GCM10008170_18270 [Methylopila capsulata]|uniref:Uncharacterized protein n=1 Tax=Methylopila capsulata TaxID=61654 RepID=A0A9W6ITB1_9HYPH|nr:hypothetical protein GCM10008170_18270 [Methylopila capsulata]